MAPAGCAAPWAGGGIEGPSEEGAIEPIERGIERGIEGPSEGAIEPIERGTERGIEGPSEGAIEPSERGTEGPL